jgi:hypothetical protein
MPDLDTNHEIEKLRGATAKLIRLAMYKLSHHKKPPEYYERCKMELDAAEVSTKFLGVIEGKKPSGRPAKQKDQPKDTAGSAQPPLVKGFTPGSQVKPA